LSSLDTTDIQSISFIIDAPAASLYRSAAANGGAVLTTKTEKQGEINVTFRSERAVLKHGN
jgi:hypothetical protein